MDKQIQNTKPTCKPYEIIYTCTEVAEYLGMAISSVRQAARRGDLEGVYGGLDGNRLVGITSRSLNALMARRREIAEKRQTGYQTRAEYPAANCSGTVD